MRNLALFVLVVLVWVMLGLHIAANANGGDRAWAVGGGLVIALLALSASRRPTIPRSRDLGVAGGADGSSGYESQGSQPHGGLDDGGHSGSDGGDGGGH